ncbi:MAG: ABC transporter permease [Phycisphaerales bacterium]
MFLRQTSAMLLDAYRELNAKKLFWFTVALSTLVAAAVACVGLNDRGFTILWWTISADIFNTKYVSPAAFYKLVFVQLGLKLWLTWIAAILALVSTSSIIPDFVASGSIDLSLSKPIGRLRLFLTKYFTSLMFVTLQVTLFTLACFLIIGLRGKLWAPTVFLAIPLVVLFFSYLYCVCALVGLVTRSTIASLLITMLFWFILFVLNSGEQAVRTFQYSAELQLATAEKQAAPLADQVSKAKAKVEQLQIAPERETPDDMKTRLSDLATEQARLAGLELRQQKKESSVKELRTSFDTLTLWHRGLYAVKTVLPKTAETMTILERNLHSLDDMAAFREAEEKRVEERREARRQQRGAKPDDDESPREARELADRTIEAELQNRPLWWVLGTSIAFEIVVLGLACAIFSRRDF